MRLTKPDADFLRELSRRESPESWQDFASDEERGRLADIARRIEEEIDSEEEARFQRRTRE